jgi:hypothetical protein
MRITACEIRPSATPLQIASTFRQALCTFRHMNVSPQNSSLRRGNVGCTCQTSRLDDTLLDHREEA